MSSDDTLSRGERTRTAILDAAQALFLEQGYNGTSLRQIAQRAGGIAVGGIYNHFSSKEDIFRALLAARSPYPTVIETLESLDGDSGPELLRAAFGRLHPVITAHLDFIQLALIDYQEFDGATIRELVGGVIPYLLAFVQRLQTTGGLRDDVHPFVILRAFVCLFIGYTLTEWIGFRDGEPAIPNLPFLEGTRWQSAMLDVLLRGVAGREELGA
jgi:AcrR family transcriptional regulator